MASDISRIVSDVAAGSSQAAARLITLLENDGPQAAEALRTLHPHTGRAHVVGITGPPGSGKSTLVNAAIAALRAEGVRVAVVAVDPSSPFTGGALLGDRIRMQEHSTDPEVFVRSMATRGSLGGLAPATDAAVAVLDAWGAATVFVETVGTGQAEVDVVSTADTVVVVLTPGLGDGVQTIKAGVMEIGDVFVVNKADRPEADRTVTDLKTTLALIPDGRWRPPVLTTVATAGEGVAAVLSAVADHRRRQEATGDSQLRRRDRWRREILRVAERRWREQVLAPSSAVHLARLVERVAAGLLDPGSAAEALVGGAAAGRLEPRSVDSHPATAGPAPAVVRPDHIGIAVRKLDEAGRFYRHVLGLAVGEPELLLEHGITASFVELSGIRIELLEPATPDGPIARFIERRGEGLHHVAFAVPDITRALHAAREAGLLLLDDAPRPGAHGSRVAFLHPKSTHGVLIELVEPSAS